MNVLYFISVHIIGQGGHYHSLLHLSSVIGQNHNIIIISLGPNNSDILGESPFFFRHIFFNGINFLGVRQIIRNVIFNFQPDIVHCFDVGSYCIVRLFLSPNKYKFVLNLCGGPNPKRFPYVKNLVLFSLENFEWFKNQKKFRGSRIFLIPNRVKALQPSLNYEPIKKERGIFIFMRICRIGNVYKKSILDSINLISVILENNVNNVKLIIIGVIEDFNLYETLSTHEYVKKGYLIILTDYKFTRNASKMLYLADAVIGTGRGLMEAASLGKPLLVLNKDGNLPVLLTEDNFKNAFITNFSERNIFPSLNNRANIDRILQIINDSEYYDLSSLFAKKVFKKYFDIDEAYESYINAYNNSELFRFDFLSEFPFLLKHMLKFLISFVKLQISSHRYLKLLKYIKMQFVNQLVAFKK